VISHKAELHDKFENVIKFDKIKGFSRISVWLELLEMDLLVMQYIKI
jgi:hypothetical protein